MNRDETLRAIQELAQAPAAKWIGNRLDGTGVGAELLQKCLRCGVEQRLGLPPLIFDEQLYTWKKTFQLAHASCVE